MPTEFTRWVRHRWRGVSLALALALVPSASGMEPSAAPSEYEVKAAFLFNFAKYVTWPPAAFASPDEPIRLGVLGDDPFDGELARLVEGRRVQGRAIVIVQGATLAALGRCHVLFISGSEQERLSKLLADLRKSDSPALTVNDGDGLAAGGIMIRFIVEENKVRFAINPGAAREAGLTISSKLLSLAVNARPRS